jgi:hypothetical protein
MRAADVCELHPKGPRSNRCMVLVCLCVCDIFVSHSKNSHSMVQDII